MSGMDDLTVAGGLGGQAENKGTTLAGVVPATIASSRHPGGHAPGRATRYRRTGLGAMLVV
jgi:hypothetical protein